MIRRILPSQLKGRICVPTSKSLLHRRMILQWLAGEQISAPADAADDICATARALETLHSGGSVIDCGMSGSTLRFLLPLAMASGRVGTVFTGAPRLLERPLSAPLPMERVENGIRVTDALCPGTFLLSAGETSQLISGLLMALPLLEAPSEIRLTTPMVSEPYVDMTIRVMARHGVTAERIADGFSIPAPQKYRAASREEEGDWSAAAGFLTYNALMNTETVIVENLCRPSLQGDSRIEGYLRAFPETVDISATPDLFPMLALFASLQRGKTTHFTHAGFLRGKESDRLSAAAAILRAVGAQVTEEEDGLTVCGTAKLRGGVAVDARNDHRMAMLAAFAGALTSEPIILYGAESVSKSYPRFWEDYAALGGKTEVAAP